MIRNWKEGSKAAKGVKIPEKFVKLMNLCKENKECIVHDIYSLMLNPALYDMAYREIKSNPGNMTKGTNSETLDGWGYNSMMKIIDSLKHETFQFSQA